jgi:peptide/nickel transport system substrate-binding protein
MSIVLIAALTTMLLISVTSVGGVGVPNPDTINWATIGGPDADWGNDPSGEYDTSSAGMIMQVLEPLCMFNGTSTSSFIPMLSDNWPGLGVNLGNGITPSAPDPAAPAGTEETWYFHIRPNVKWQDPTYGVLTPADVEYHFERGMLQDAATGVQWLLYTPLTGSGPGNSLDPMFDTNGDGEISATEYVKLDAAIDGAVQSNSSWVWFNLPAPFGPFQQILTQSWAQIINKQWAIERGCWNGQHGNYTEFLRIWQPSSSPLMASAVTSSSEPMMGTGPYMLKAFNTDPHTGFQSFEKFDDYWQGWPSPGATGFAKFVHVKVVEEWANRKAQFFSNDPGLQIDLTDVPTANCPEIHIGGNQNGPTYPGFRLTKYAPQVTGALFFCYNVSSPSDFMPKLGTNDKPDLFSDRDLRLAIQYCFNATQLIEQYFLGEAIQPNTIMAKGTAFYNDSKPIREINLDLATQHFQAAWGGQVWSQGITVKLVYNTGNLARQTVMNQIADVIQHRIVWPAGARVQIDVIAEPWSIILPAMDDHAIADFVIGWMADYPDPSNWFGPFMDPAGTYSGIGQVIQYGLGGINAAWYSGASYGPPPYTNALGETVTAINNTYVAHIIAAALGGVSTLREKLYNELMDIQYAEAGSFTLYQATARHYERSWLNGWAGRYSNNPIAPSHYFYQLWKAATGTVFEVHVSATESIANVTTAYPYVQNYQGEMRLSGKAATINYTLHVAYVTGTPDIYVSIGLMRNDTAGTYFFPVLLTRSMSPGEDATVTASWYEKTGVPAGYPGIADGDWTLIIYASPLGTGGGNEVVDSNPADHYAYSAFVVKVRTWRVDVDGSGTVNILDISAAAKAFGATPGNPRWNPLCDFNGDGVVNILDIATIARSWNLVFTNIASTLK